MSKMCLKNKYYAISPILPTKNFVLKPRLEAVVVKSRLLYCTQHRFLHYEDYEDYADA